MELFGESILLYLVNIHITFEILKFLKKLEGYLLVKYVLIFWGGAAYIVCMRNINFFGELREKLQETKLDNGLSFKYYGLGKNRIYFMGIVSILEFDNERVVLNLKHSKIEVVGKNLSIIELGKNEIIVSGIIEKICF